MILSSLHMAFTTADLKAVALSYTESILFSRLAPRWRIAMEVSAYGLGIDAQPLY